MKYYLTDSIFIENDTMYFSKKNTIKKINRNNWHHILKEYGWNKLPLPWIKQLNKLSSSILKNSGYGVLDCESDGNCFFQCIANALNEKNRQLSGIDYEEYNSEDIRSLIANSITEEMFSTLITYYRIMKDANDFDEEWDPYLIKNVDQFRDQLKKTGHNYWGDYLLFNHILSIFKLNIFILNSNDYSKNYTVYNTLNDYNSSYDTIYLLYEDECHFKLIGYFNGDKMISYFTKDTIPEELLKLYNIIR